MAFLNSLSSFKSSSKAAFTSVVIVALLFGLQGCNRPTLASKAAPSRSQIEEQEHFRSLEQIESQFRRTGTVTIAGESFLFTELKGNVMQNELLAGAILSEAAKRGVIASDAFLKAVHWNLVTKRGLSATNSFVIYSNFMGILYKKPDETQRTELRSLQRACNDAPALSNSEKTFVEDSFKSKEYGTKLLGINLILFKDHLEPQDREWFLAKAKEQKMSADTKLSPVWKEVESVIRERT